MSWMLLNVLLIDAEHVLFVVFLSWLVFTDPTMRRITHGLKEPVVNPNNPKDCP